MGTMHIDTFTFGSEIKNEIVHLVQVCTIPSHVQRVISFHKVSKKRYCLYKSFCFLYRTLGALPYCTVPLAVHSTTANYTWFKIAS